MEENRPPNFIAQENGNLIIVRMNGDINAQTLPESRKMIDELVKLHHIYERENLCILIDYENVTNVDSAAIANILERLQEHHDHYHRIAFINVPDEFVKLLEIYKLQDTISVFDSEKKALAELQKH